MRIALLLAAVGVALVGSRALGIFQSLLGALTILNVSLLFPMALYLGMFKDTMVPWLKVSLVAGLVGGSVLVVYVSTMDALVFI